MYKINITTALENALLWDIIHDEFDEEWIWLVMAVCSMDPI